MSKLYNHTYWDGSTVERYTSARGRRPGPEPEPFKMVCGPDQPLKEAIKMLAYERHLEVSK